MDTPSDYQTCTVPACDLNTSINTREETAKDLVTKLDCDKQRRDPTEIGQYYKCCSLSPVEPNPLINIDCCKKKRPCLSNFCSAVNGECQDFELTPYGKEFVLQTGRLVSEHLRKYYFSHEILICLNMLKLIINRNHNLINIL